MKKWMALCMSLLMMSAVLSACGTSHTDDTSAGESNSQQSETGTERINSSETEASDTTESNSASKSLVVYFSMPETTEPDNMSREEELSTVVIDGEVLGNTQYVAQVIAENTGADIFHIEPVTPYPLDHSELEEIAQQEQRDDARPEIAGTVENIGQYSTIFFGFPKMEQGFTRV